MPKHIKKLTKEQKAAMPEFAKKWIDIGLKTGEADWETFNKYMPVCYEKAGLKYPRRVVRVKSPLVGALAAAVAEGILRQRRRDAVRDAVRGAVGEAVCGAVDSAVGEAVDSAVGEAVRDAVDGAVGEAVDGAVGNAVDSAVGEAVDGAVGGAVGGAVDSAVGEAVDSAVGEAVRDAVRDAVSIAKKTGVSFSWHYWLGGQFWVGGYWWGSVAFIAFFMDVCQLKLAEDIVERATAYRKVCESVNYIWPNRDFVMVCERPSRIERDDRGRLHSASGKAIEYPDGWGLYFLHGVKFDEKLWRAVSSGSIPVPEIFAIKNTEQRRVAYEMLDKVKMAELPDLKVLDKVADDGRGYPMRIIAFKHSDFQEPFRFLNCFCPSTGREYYIETRRDKCWEAKAASFGLSESKKFDLEF